MLLQAIKHLDKDIQQSLLTQLRDLWTHTSTAIEGNTLTLGETKFIIEEGLTVSGKPLKDHQEVTGHSRAIDLVYSCLDRDLSTDDIFAFHQAIQIQTVIDIYHPIGAWKVESNGTYAVSENGQQLYVEYAKPQDVPALMDAWLSELNRLSHADLNQQAALEVYAKLHMGFVHIHPFCDGNGRMARLLSNIPLLKAGHLPLVINQRDRQNYIQLLASYQIHLGPLSEDSGVWPDNKQLVNFIKFCSTSYQQTSELLKQAEAQQGKR